MHKEYSASCNCVSNIKNTTFIYNKIIHLHWIGQNFDFLFVLISGISIFYYLYFYKLMRNTGYSLTTHNTTISTALNNYV